MQATLTAKNGPKWQQQQYNNRHQCSINDLHQVILSICRQLMFAKQQNRKHNIVFTW